MQPRTEGPQHCLNFRLQTNPRAQIFAYRDALGNTVHHFDVPGRHGRLTVTAETLVELDPPPPLPVALPADAWDELDAWPPRASTGSSCSPATSRTPRRRWPIWRPSWTSAAAPTR